MVITIDPSATTVCALTGSTVSFLTAGTCVIDANQAGDANYTAAPLVQQSFAVGAGAQTITVTSTAPAAAVVGATYPDEIRRVRELAPTLPLVIPGVGAQGGDAQSTVQAGWRGQDGKTTGSVIVNSSRAVLYASAGPDFAQAARAEALRTRDLLNAGR